jgi:hypothetical protein
VHHHGVNWEEETQIVDGCRSLGDEGAACTWACGLDYKIGSSEEVGCTVGRRFCSATKQFMETD